MTLYQKVDKKVTDAFIYLFPDMLLTEPIQKDATHLPSPDQLKRKIILKVNLAPKKGEYIKL